MKLAPYSLSVSIPGLMLTFGLLSLGLLYYAGLQNSYEHLESIKTPHVEILGSMAASSIEADLERDDLGAVQRSIERMRGDLDILRAALVDPEGRILASTDPEDSGRSLGETPFSQMTISMETMLSDRQPHVTFAPEAGFVLGVFPVEFSGIREDRRSAGPAILLTLHDLKEPLKSARAAAQRGLAAAAVILTLFCGLLWLIIRMLLISRINKLISATERIAGGEFDAPLPTEGEDELRRLSTALSRMAHGLHESDRELRENEEHYRSIIENMQDIVSIIDRDLIFEYVSPSTSRISGFAPEQFEGKSAFTGVPEEDAVRSRELFEKVLSGELEQCEFESRFAQADGTVAYYHTLCRPISAPGKPRRLLTVSRNIMEMRRATSALEESEERFNSLFESLTAGAWAISADGSEFLYGNTALARIYGRPLEEFSANNNLWLEVVHPEDMELARQSMEEVLQTGSADHEYRIVLPDGEVRWIRDRKQTIRGAAGQILRMGGLVTDITDAKKTQEDRIRLEAQLRQTQKMEAIGTLAGGVAHDFNNLLTAINGYSELLQESMGDDHELIEEVREIRAAGERAAALTRQLLLFSRQDVVQPKELDLNALVHDLGRMLTRLIGEHIEFKSTLSSESLTIWADPGQIEQVIVNLVVNARDAMEGGGTLSIRTERVRLTAGDVMDNEDVAPGNYAKLSVEDNGCGMSEVILARIFEPFFTTKEVGKGTGLGLATIFGIVKQCSGYISARSRKGEGSTFEVFLPLATENKGASVDGSALNPGVGGTETILFVEDERIVREVGARILRQQGYRVLEAVHGADALKIAGENQGDIHLVVSDLVLPQMTGRELVTHLLELNPDLRVLFVSGYAERISVSVEDVHLPEGIPFLQKPYDPKSLAAKVRTVLDGPAPTKSIPK